MPEPNNLEKPYYRRSGIPPPPLRPSSSMLKKAPWIEARGAIVIAGAIVASASLSQRDIKINRGGTALNRRSRRRDTVHRDIMGRYRRCRRAGVVAGAGLARRPCLSTGQKKAAGGSYPLRPDFLMRDV